MRIRKRFLSLSAAITAPRSSDLHGGDHNDHPLVLVQHQELHPNGNQHVLYDNTGSQFSDPPNHCHHSLPPSSSDHATQIGLQSSTWVSSGDGSDPKKTKELESERKKETIQTDDTGCRKESILCAEANSHDLVLKGWLEGDRMIPIKKRRGSFRKTLNHDVVQDNEMIEETLMKPKPKIKNDKFVAMSAKKNNKNEKRGNVIMEGSRCSRVNGRGWRCSQQTLVGYSLCEHHLGKGRLKTMTSVRGQAQKVAPKEQHTKEWKDKKAESTSIDHHEFEDDDDDDDEEEEFKDWEVESMSSMKGTKIFSKKTKLGVVKARSLSSLLSQIGS